RFCSSDRPASCGPVLFLAHALDQREHRKNQEHDKQDLGNRSSTSGNATKTQHSSHDSYNKKDYGVVKHTILLIISTYRDSTLSDGPSQQQLMKYLQTKRFPPANGRTCRRSL